MHNSKREGVAGKVEKSVGNDARMSILSQAPGSQKVYQQAFQLAQAGAPLLIRGAAGTGKLALARALQFLRRRESSDSWFHLHCSKWSNQDTRLFWEKEKDSVTRVIEREAIGSNVLLLHEVGDLSSEAQVEVLDALKALRSRNRVGLQVIATTREDLGKMVQARQFSSELFDLLSKNEVHLSPLVERPEDIPAFVDYFFKSLRDELKRADLTGVSIEALRVLSLYDWPGNLAELRGALYQALVVAQGPNIEKTDLPQRLLVRIEKNMIAAEGLKKEKESQQMRLPQLPSEGIQLSVELERIEQSLLQQALTQSDGSLSEAAQLLGLPVDEFEQRFKPRTKFKVA